jgi:hypothetical protein
MKLSRFLYLAPEVACARAIALSRFTEYNIECFSRKMFEIGARDEIGNGKIVYPTQVKMGKCRKMHEI